MEFAGGFDIYCNLQKAIHGFFWKELHATGTSSSMADEPQLIEPVGKSVVHRICAGQVILDLSSVVKELVENSLTPAPPLSK
ncbi:hypothetical protein Ahy_B06g084415 isoform B [Arachis hypogaea]|uniref:Uncharacterized protein n=1 Tax=Arachis hypogaea TaxID=3818 RepID=A0A444YRU5_ARAHY|nr:hypothetical protein Ahy_B06g084415 isoform B [Arachis hypogaea]